MFEVENFFLYQEARKVITLNRQELVPYFKIINEYIANNSLLLGGIVGIKNYVASITSDECTQLEYEDLIFEIKTQDVQGVATNLARELASDIGLKKVYTMTNNPNNKIDIYCGRFLLAKVTWYYPTIQTSDKPLLACYLETIYEDLLTSQRNARLEELLIKTLPRGRVISPNLSFHAINRDCMIIKGTNIFITKEQSFIDELNETIGGELKKTGEKYTLKKDKEFITIYLTARKRAFPCMKEKDIIYAHPLTSLYHLSLGILNEVIFGFIHRARAEYELIKKRPIDSFDQYGYLDYVDRQKLTYEMYGM